MGVILLEVVSLLAGIAGITFLVRAMTARSGPALRARQAANRRAIERTAALTCPIHGLQDEASLVRLPDGTTLCAACYRDAHLDERLPS